MYLSCRLLAALCILAAAPAPAQTGGEVLWEADLDGFATMSQPRVAPDGTVYVVTNRLYAFDPDGTLKWTAPAFESYVDVGPDGTVYTGGGRTVYAYNPDGTERWQFTEPPGGQGLMQGPTVGPDGNVYAVTDFGGLGAFSLTPQGQLRWNVPGFVNREGTGLGRVQFGPDNLYFAEDVAPGCDPLQDGMASVTLDGQLDWCLPISGVARPTATLDGKAITYQEGFSGRTLLAFNPAGDLVWTYTYSFNDNAISSVGVGPDNNLYVWNLGSLLSSLTAGGALRWKESQPVNNFPWRAVVAPDLSSVVSGSVYGFGNNGEIVAADPADGGTFWEIPVTGPSAGAGAPAAFSPDGSVVYVPVNTISFDVPDQLWAIRVRDAAQQPVTVVVAPVDPPVVIGPGGGSFQFTVTLTNTTGQSQTFEAWSAVTGPLDREPVVGPIAVTLPAGVAVTRTLVQQVPGNAPAGEYTYVVNVGDFPGVVSASASFPVVKAGGALAVAPGGSVAGGAEWSVSGWDEGAEASVTAALPEGFALSGVVPNPSDGRAALTLDLAEGQAVAVAVFDALGRRVAVVHEGPLAAGTHTLAFDGSALPAGVYVVRATGEAFAAARHVVVVR